jgi:polar amino acid transport system substrate-binding protein
MNTLMILNRSARVFFQLKLSFVIFLILSIPLQVYASSNKETIILIGEDSWYPYTAFKDGKLRGLSVDLLEASYAAVNVQVKFKAVPYARCLMLMSNGEELGCFNTIKYDELKEVYLFHEEPLFKAEIGIYATTCYKNEPIGLKDLKGKKVGLTHGYTYSHEINTDLTMLREVAPTDISNLRKLLLNRSDYSIVFSRVADYLLKAHASEFKGKICKVGNVSQKDVFVSFSKHHPKGQYFANLLDQGLLIIKKNGIYRQIEQRWESSNSQ